MITSTSHEDLAHERLLERLWNVSFPDSEDAFCGNSSELWSSIGFQGRDPFTDTRGGGLLSLLCIVWLFENRGDIVRRIKTTQSQRVKVCKEKGLDGPAAFPNYPLACACIHVTRMLCGIFGVSGIPGKELAFESHKLSFWPLLLKVGTPTSFYALFCVALDFFDRNYTTTENSNYMAFNAIFNETKAQFHAMLKAWARGDKDLETRLRKHHAVQPNPYRRPTRRQRHRPTEAAHSPSTSPSPAPSLPLLPSLSQEKSKKSLSLEHPSARIDPDLAELFADMPSEEGAAAASLAPASERVTATKTHTGVKPKDDFFASYGL